MGDSDIFLDNLIKVVKEKEDAWAETHTRIGLDELRMMEDKLSASLKELNDNKEGKEEVEAKLKLAE